MKMLTSTKARVLKIYPNDPPTLGTNDKYLKINTQTGIHILPIKEVLYCEALSNYVTIRLKSGENILASKTLKHIEYKLSGHGFIRCHRSFLVQVVEIRAIDSHQMKLSNNQNIPISRSKRTSVLSAFKDNMNIVSISK